MKSEGRKTKDQKKKKDGKTEEGHPSPSIKEEKERVTLKGIPTHSLFFYPHVWHEITVFLLPSMGQDAQQEHPLSMNVRGGRRTGKKEARRRWKREKTQIQGHHLACPSRPTHFFIPPPLFSCLPFYSLTLCVCVFMFAPTSLPIPFLFVSFYSRPPLHSSFLLPMVYQSCQLATFLQ